MNGETKGEKCGSGGKGTTFGVPKSRDSEEEPEANIDKIRSGDIDLRKQRDLICEALVREIARAARWSAIAEAWSALLHTRNMADTMLLEQDAMRQSDSTRQRLREGSDRRPLGQGFIVDR